MILRPLLDSTAKVQVAVNDIDCIPMGEGCFNPQFGYMEDVKPQKKDAEKEVEIKTINALETDLINCDEKNYFDLFCGKAKQNAAKVTLEVWIDTSSSLRNVDFSADENFCKRRVFVEQFREACGDKISFSTFDTSIKQLGTAADSCNTYGLNNTKKIIDWIKGTTTENLIIITDIDEYNDEMEIFLTQIGGKSYGTDVKKLMIDELPAIIKKSTKFCKK